MKSTYRIFLFFLIFPLVFGYNPVTDTLSRSLGLDFLSGQSDYYTGCESPTKTMTFKEIHAGYRSNLFSRITFHIDGGLVPTDVEPTDNYGGGRDLFGYIVGGYDVNWEYFGFGLGLGNSLPFIDPYLRLGSSRIIYADAGFSHRFPLGSSGVFSAGVGSGFGTDDFNVWVGGGSGFHFGGLADDKFEGFSARLDCRVSKRLAFNLGVLNGDNNSKSAWLGLRYYF